MGRKTSGAVAAAAPTRGRGRPKKTETKAPAVVAPELPKNRGRPEKAQKANGAPVQTIGENNAKSAGRRGRPRKEETAVEKTPAKATRTSARAEKTVPAAQSSSISKRRGPHKSVSKAPKAPKAAPRVDPRVRSRLRDRAQLLEAKKKASAKASAEVPARRGQPRGHGGPKRGPGRPKKDGTSPAVKVTARKVAQNAVTKHRARKGYTIMEVPKKYIAQLQQHLLHLEANDEAAQTEEMVEDQLQQEMDVDAQTGAQEELNGHPTTNGANEATIEEITVQSAIQQEDEEMSGMAEEVPREQADGQLQNMLDGEGLNQDPMSGSFSDSIASGDLSPPSIVG